MDFQFLNYLCLLLLPFFVICVICYLLIFAIIDLRYAFKSRNNPEKKGNPKYFKNEILTGFMFILLSVLYPFLFIYNVPNENVRAQIYFHLWHSISWHVPGWLIYLYFAKKNNKKKNRTISYESWKEQVRANYKDNVKADIKRKAMHLISSVIIIGFFILGKMLERYVFIPEMSEWDAISFTLYMQVNVGIHFLWLMNIGEILRLMKFDKLGKMAHNWMEGAIKPDELDTYSTATIMGLALAPFFIGPPQILICVVLITSLSDAMASIIGKKFGKIRSKKLGTKKTAEGYIAGFITTYLIVILVYLFVPDPNIDIFVINFMALGAALGFFFVDRFAKDISDNFLNPIICGGCIVIIYILFTL